MCAGTRSLLQYCSRRSAGWCKRSIGTNLVRNIIYGRQPCTTTRRTRVETLAGFALEAHRDPGLAWWLAESTEMPHTSPPSAFNCSLLYLKFDGQAVERDYCSSTSTRALLHLDSTICSIKLAVTVFMVALIAARVLPATPLAFGLWVGYMTLLWAQHLAFTMAPGVCSAHREPLIVAFKLAYAGVLLALVPTFLLEPVHGPGTFIKVLVMGSGLVLLNCTGVLMPIRWRLHIITGLILAAVTIAAVTPALIDTLLCTPTGRRYTAAAAGALDALSREVANILLPLGPGGGARCPRLEAGALVLALQLCCGLVAPSLYLYISELRCRQSYLARMRRGGSSWLLSPLLEGPNGLPVAIVLGSLLLLLAASAWNLARLVAPAALPLLETTTLAAAVRRLAAQHGAGACAAAGPVAVGV